MPELLVDVMLNRVTKLGNNVCFVWSQHTYNKEGVQEIEEAARDLNTHKLNLQICGEELNAKASRDRGGSQNCGKKWKEESKGRVYLFTGNVKLYHV